MSISTEKAREAFSVDYKGDDLNSDDIIILKINAIDPACDKLELAQKTDEIVALMAEKPDRHNEGYLEIIKDHFGYTSQKQLDTWRKDINRARKDSAKAAKTSYGGNGKAGDPLPVGTKEILDKIKNETEVRTINLPQDYYDGKMYYTAQCGGHQFLINSDKEIIRPEDFEGRGIRPHEESVDICNLNRSGVVAFMESKDKTNIADLYCEIGNYIKRFVVLPDGRWVSLLAVWVMGTYIHRIFRYCAYINATAAKQSGKTLLMEILKPIVFNGEIFINPSEAVMFRVASRNSPTLFIDEAENLGGGDKEIERAYMGILKAGFQKGGSVPRCDGDTHEVRRFPVYSPKFLAGIKPVEDVLQDRGIKLLMKRKLKNEKTDRYKETDRLLDQQQSFRDRLYIFGLQYGPEIAETYEDIEGTGIKGMSHLENREENLWEPLFLIGNLIDREFEQAGVVNDLQSLSMAIIEQRRKDNETDNETFKATIVMKRLIDDTSPMPIQDSEDILTYDAQKVFEYFKESEHFDWLKEKNRTLATLSRHLRGLPFFSKARRTVGGEKVSVYEISKSELNDYYDRYISASEDED